MAPEQLQTSSAYLGTAVDVWASGVLLLVMMVNFSSFTARDGPLIGFRPHILVRTIKGCDLHCLHGAPASQPHDNAFGSDAGTLAFAS